MPARTTPPAAFISQEVDSSRLFFLDPSEDDGFSVVLGGFERCAPDYHIDRQRIPWFCLEFVSHGEGMLHLGSSGHPLQPGTFYVYGPSTPHRITSVPESPLRKYFVGFTGDDVARWLDQYEMPPGFVSRSMKPEPIRRAFDTLIDRGVRKSRFTSPLCAAITRQLLLMCREDATDPADTGTAAFASYNRAREFIERNFVETSTLEAIAKACGIDAPYLCRLFARFHAESPYQFLTRLRMERASQLLLEEGASVKSVAALLGFKDPFHFSRVFKAAHHVPPSRFRKSMG